MMKKAGSFQLSEGVMLQFPYLSFSILISTGGLPFLYFSFHQNGLIHMPSFFHLLHSLMHSSIALHNLMHFSIASKAMHFSIASKAMHSFTIRYLQVGYLYSSLDLNIL